MVNKRNPLVPFDPPRSLEGWHLYEPPGMPHGIRHSLVPFDPPRSIEGWYFSTCRGLV
ncbi:MAG: hypothetical protein QT05_C0051G0027 [archaeon GW2011_AR13]|nr:MAG: hypothetical protein QT05_C0051G0027 [archaeon GW2011_AR13]